MNYTPKAGDVWQKGTRLMELAIDDERDGSWFVLTGRKLLFWECWYDDEPWMRCRPTGLKADGWTLVRVAHPSPTP